MIMLSNKHSFFISLYIHDDGELLKEQLWNLEDQQSIKQAGISLNRFSVRNLETIQFCHKKEQRKETQYHDEEKEHYTWSRRYFHDRVSDLSTFISITSIFSPLIKSKFLHPILHNEYSHVLDPKSSLSSNN